MSKTCSIRFPLELSISRILFRQVKGIKGVWWWYYFILLITFELNKKYNKTRQYDLHATINPFVQKKFHRKLS